MTSCPYDSLRQWEIQVLAKCGDLGLQSGLSCPMIATPQLTKQVFTMRTFNLINASNGAVILRNVTEQQFDSWYDSHPFWRTPRSPEEVAPELRKAWLLEDTGNNAFLVEG